MLLKSYFIFLIIFMLTDVSLLQDCVFSGEYCIDDAACCGGCCKNRICIDTYVPCMIQDDPCLMHSCPPGLECYVYQPDCTGCEPFPDCRDRKN